jgi:hypothetical protein
MMNEPRILERSVVKLSVTPSTKGSCSGLPLQLANGGTTIDRRGGLTSRDGDAVGSLAEAFSRTAPRRESLCETRFR